MGDKLPDPNSPAYQRARVAMANHLFAIGRDEPASGYGRMADSLMCGDLIEVPTWLALGMIAEASEARSLSKDNGEGEALSRISGEDRK